jgi:hypothetical protein
MRRSIHDVLILGSILAAIPVVGSLVEHTEQPPMTHAPSKAKPLGAATSRFLRITASRTGGASRSTRLSLAGQTAARGESRSSCSPVVQGRPPRRSRRVRAACFAASAASEMSS